MAGPKGLKSLTTQQAALHCDVNRRTMLRWVKSGKLPSFQTPGGRQRILPPDLVKFMRQQGIPVPPELLAKPDDGLKIVIVDDDVNHTRALVRAIHALIGEATIRSASDGFAGGLLVRDLQPDVLLLDVVMPGMDGFSVCRSIRAQPALDHTAIVMVSGYLDDETSPMARDAGADLVLPKPVDPAALASALNHVRNGVREAS